MANLEPSMSMFIYGGMVYIEYYACVIAAAAAAADISSDSIR